MSYENRRVPEGINVSREHPLREFFWLSVATIGILVALVAIIAVGAESIAPYVPFKAEKRLGGLMVARLTDSAAQDPRDQPIKRYLQSLADRLAMVQRLPDTIKVTVHYVDRDVLNAMALLGGHIVVYRGLLEHLPHENALSMVLAHEIAHIKHRDPLIALGRGVILATLLSALTGFSDSGFMDGLVAQAGMITALKFNRDQESAADLEAINALETLYGHVYGATAFFEMLEDKDHGIDSLAFMRSHPATKERIQRIKNHQATDSHVEKIGLVALPEEVMELHAKR